MGQNEAIRGIGGRLMKIKKMKYLWFIVILATFCLTLLLARTRSKVEMRNRIYRQWSEHFVVSDGKQSYVRTTTSDEETTVLSEAQSYGMLITVKAAKKGQASQADFESLYRYYLNNRLNGTQLMSWKQTIKEGQVTAKGQNATDGDLYIAYALLEAAKQWPKQAQEYREQAKSILEDILKYNYNEKTGVLTMGNWADKNSDYYYLMRTSDTLPHYFQTFYELTGNDQWLSIKDKMLEQLDQISSQSETGLLPDFIWVDETGARVADPDTIESEYDGFYSYNACRLPYNLAQSQDEISQKLVNKMLDFFMTQRRLYAGYDLKGNALQQHQAASYLAPIVYASEKENTYLKLVQQHKYIFTQDLPLDTYYDATITTMIALDLF